MEERYIYPTDDVKPIRVGDGYSDYHISDILSSFGFWDQWIGFDGSVAIVHAINGFGAKIIRVHPHDDAITISPLTRASDIVVRYSVSSSDRSLVWIEIL